MGTRLRTLAEAVHAKLVANGIAGVDMRIGINEASFHGSKLRLVWIEASGKLEPPRQAGGRLSGDSTKRIVACKVRTPSIIARIYGGSDEATEALFEDVIAAVCELGEGNFEMPGYRWVTQEENHGGNALRTELIELTIVARWPVSSEIGSLRAITGSEVTCGTIGGTESDWTVVPHG